MRLISSVVLAVLFLVVTLNMGGCATASSYMKQDERTREYNASRKDLYDAVIASAGELKWKVENSDPGTGMIYLHPPLNLFTSSLGNAMKGGDIVEVELSKISDTITRVSVEQQSRGEIIDWGRASGNIKALFKKLDARLDKR